jgi:hypothetical protein
LEIRFKNVTGLERRTSAHDLSFSDSELIRGDVEIDFTHGSKMERFRQSNVNVPLVIAEARLFFDQLIKSNRATWRFCFSPFVDGRRESGKVTLFTGSANDPEGGTVQELTEGQVQRLQSLLSTLQWRYGRLNPAGSGNAGNTAKL